MPVEPQAEETVNLTPFEQSASFAEELAICLSVQDMIDKIPTLSTEPLQEVAWEAVAALLLSVGGSVGEA